ncbi:mucosa-associated lymphoid tissue lymphoma translocation protein 1-like isoform X1 [Asterias rubens]|uniref:mucosa-associated lymphoid tissue lymphoma translocation protein 1-like isoform X1 n=1 Tax=Asterias rubens TaxID=7604 RepID=UPI0014555C93|nr:mucosa-associated lymphoid tissue lymphoma translocation protein 1-like isoform X1 [Asterias rubens]XP_033634697.1 mucosa-associated lymphoid tissue lymphoma translocation protein 1-like isoform X1 [Asterias rubens]
MAWINTNGAEPDTIDPDSVITELPFTVLLALSEYLNVGDSKMNWRGVIAQIPEKIFSDDEVEAIALSIHEYNGSPALKLLRKLGGQGRSVRQLISYLDRLNHEKCLKLIKKTESLRLLQVPISQTVQSGPGTVVVFACKARGFPYPHYRWYQAFGLDSCNPHSSSKNEKEKVSHEEVPGGTDRVLKISPVRLSHSGAYCCQVYHKINGKIKQVFTDWAYLQVYPPAKEDLEFSDSDIDYQLMQKPTIVQQPPGALSVRPGKPIIVECRATGCPQPKYQWYKFGYLTHGDPLEPHALRDQQKQTLYWAQSTADDKGMYQCRVWNKAGCITSKTVAITVDSRLPESYPDHITIEHHPESVSSRIGEQRFLFCRANVTEGNLFFQWFLNGQEIPGATQSKLHFLPVKPEDRGMYQCRIQNDHVCVWSNQAMLEIIGVEQPTSEFKYSATDKVALLIGNQDYRSAKRLIAPELDVEKLAVVLSELDFKVISLLNLNLQEMNFALSAFCALLNSGVYGLFYFSGHGFSNDGQSYMIPVDAAAGYSTHECICDQHVLDQMQNRNTALNVILLDICREYNTYPQQEAAKRYTPDVRGNTVFGYAAQTNTRAWEVEETPYAFFSKYLIERIKEKKRVTHMLEDVIQDVCNDPNLTDRRQYPAIAQDLSEARTLLDPINPAGHTEEINSRSRLWGSAHLLPEMPIWMEFKYGVIVCIDIKTRFSNVLVIYSYIPITGNATNCAVKLENFTSELDIKMENQDHEGMNPGFQMTKTTVRNLQRLRGDMESTVTVEGEYQGERFQQKDTLVVTKPLVSKLWQTERYAVPSETPSGY